MADRLVAWLYGTPVLSLMPAFNNRIIFDWEQRGIDRWGLASRVLSVSLPLGSPTSSRDDRALDFFSNLLPDGPVLIAMAQLAGVSALDTFGLLTTFGSECAGAVVLLPEGEMPPDSSLWGSENVSTHDLMALIDALPTTPFGADLGRGWTPSLPGYQGKIVLGRLSDGQWTRPTNGAPSTWILKPDREHRMAENEVTCLRLAANCGLTVPDVELLDLNGTKILAIRRYDRTEVDSPISRIHQEDGCQATGTPPMQKYEYAGGPSLKDLATVLHHHGDVNAMRELLQRVAFNVAVGNADAHAKNFSFLHGPDGLSITLAPVYDVLSTISLDKRPNADGIMVGASTTMGQEINAQADILKVSKADIISEGTKWGLRRKASEECVAEVFDAVSASIAETSGDESVLSFIHAQLTRASS
ncbi:MAG: type II toxin-antitoxin system HipA family toxin [Acidimicrobiales bacterium]